MYLSLNNPSNLTTMKKNIEPKRQGLSLEIDRQEFAMQLKTWRLRIGLTQRQTAQRWGVSRETINKAEGAKPITWELAYRLFVRLSDELRAEGGTPC